MRTQPPEMARHALHGIGSSWEDRLERFLSFPAYTLLARSGISPALHRLATRRAARAIAASPLRNTSLSDPAARHQDPADLLFLYDLVRTRRPARAIEFGSGDSTVAIAKALADSGGGHLFSLESEERWLAQTAGMIPPELSSFVTLIHSPVEVTNGYGIPAWRYTRRPEGPWDFVFVDGPALTREVTMSVDLIEMFEDLHPHAFGMIDSRWRTAIIAKHVLGRQIDFRFRPALESFTFTRAVR